MGSVTSQKFPIYLLRIPHHSLVIANCHKCDRIGDAHTCVYTCIGDVVTFNKGDASVETLNFTAS